MKVGDVLKLTADIYDDGEDHHPPGYIGRSGDTVIVRTLRPGAKGTERVYVSHPHVTDNEFLVYRNELQELRMSVRAKFRVEAIESNEAGEGSVTLEAVTSGSPENDEFFRWTPSGRLQMGTVNAATLCQFRIGDEFYIDLTKAEDAG